MTNNPKDSEFTDALDNWINSAKERSVEAENLMSNKINDWVSQAIAKAHEEVAAVTGVSEHQLEPKPQGEEHTLVAIGYIGDFQCYFDIPREQAIARYEAENGEEAMNVSEFKFTDSFKAYEVWSL